MNSRVRALIADDEPLLREHLAQSLRELWPAFELVAEARNGREALDAADRCHPDVAFLDVHMPVLNGIEAARALPPHLPVVFVTAFDHYAVQAFEQGAVDYLLKPFQPERLERCVQRVQQRLHAARQAAAASLPLDPAWHPLLDHLAEALKTSRALRPSGPMALADPEAASGAVRPLQWIKAAVGSSVKLISVEDILFLRSDDKYTLVAWTGGEALIRKTIRELSAELDPTRFVQVHRAVIVQLRHIAQVVRGPHDTAEIHLHGRNDVLPVSRNFLHHFRQM